MVNPFLLLRIAAQERGHVVVVGTARGLCGRIGDVVLLAEDALAAHRANGLCGLLRLIFVKRGDGLLRLGRSGGGILLGLRLLAKVAQAALAGLLSGTLVANPDRDALGHAVVLRRRGRTGGLLRSGGGLGQVVIRALEAGSDDGNAHLVVKGLVDAGTEDDVGLGVGGLSDQGCSLVDF